MKRIAAAILVPFSLPAAAWRLEPALAASGSGVAIFSDK